MPQELSDVDVFGKPPELSDADVFSQPKELTDADVFGKPAQFPSRPLSPEEHADLLTTGKRAVENQVAAGNMSSGEASMLTELAQQGDGNALKVIWGMANTPLFEAKPPEEQLQEAEQGTPLEKTAMGTRQGIDKFLSSFTSPLSLATLGLGSVVKNPIAQRGASALFGLPMAKEAAVDIPQELGAEMGKPEGERDIRKISELISSELTTLPMAAVSGQHAISGDPIVSRAKETDTKLLTEAINEVLKHEKSEPLKASVSESLPQDQLSALDALKAKLEDVKKLSPEENHVAESRTMVSEPPKEELTDEQAGLVEPPKTPADESLPPEAVKVPPVEEKTAVEPASELETPLATAPEVTEQPKTLSEREHYDLLQSQIREMTKADPFDERIQDLWKQSETIKNRNGGMPPEAFTKSVEIGRKLVAESENTSLLNAATAPEHIGESNEMVAPEATERPSLKALSDKWESQGVKNDVSENGEFVTLSRIVVPKEQRGGGIGSRFMDELTQYADRNGKTIALSPSVDFGGNMAGLRKFYKRFGFVENKGSAKDFRTKETMIREPSETQARKENKGAAETDTPQGVLAAEASSQSRSPTGREEAIVPQAEPVEKSPEIIGMGGAIPSEFENTPKTPTGIKNAQVDVERRSRGLPSVVEPARRGFGKVWGEAMSKIDKDPGFQDELINDLRDNPRALTDLEDALVLHRQIDLQNEYGKATRDLAQAYDDGRLDAVAEEKGHVERLSDQLLDIYEIGKKSGTETGRGLNARKMMANEDFSLASLVTQKRAAKGGRHLTDTERAELQKIADDYKAKSEALEKHVSERDSRISELEAQKAFEKLQYENQKTTASPHIIRLAEKMVRGLDLRAEAARKRIKERGFRFSAGVDPTVLLDLAEIGASHLGHIGLDFAKWSSRMVADFGDGIKPHLDEVWTASQKVVDDLKVEPAVKRHVKKSDIAEQKIDTAIKIKDKIKAGKGSEISTDVQKLARQLVASGIKTRDALIDAVHAVLKEADPNLTRRDAMDAISGYGEYHQLTKDEISVQLRDLKGQMQQIGKLEDIQAGQAPSKTGVERRQPSDEERRLIKQVEEAKRRGGYKVTDPETQLRTSIQASKTRLENQIKDLEHEIATKTKIVRDKTKAPTSPEVEALKTKRDALKIERDKLLDTESENEATRLKNYKARTAKRINELEQKLKDGDFSTRPKPTPPRMDEEGLRLKSDLERTKLEFQRSLMKDKLAKRTLPEKVQDTFVKWRRAFLLSSPVTLAKLTSAALERMVFTPAEELVGGVASKLPFVSQIAAKAPREGGFSVKAEARAIREGFTKGMSDAVHVLKTGDSSLDSVFGKPNVMPHELVDFIGATHGALKAPVKRAEFERSFEKRTEFAIRNGIDVSDPLVQTQIAVEAYKDAQRSIFMQDNRVVAAYKRALGALEEKSKVTGKVPASGKIGATVAKTFLPIIKVPTNIIYETIQTATGLFTGSARMGNAFRKGIDTLKPEEADLIMRELKKGSLGAAFMALGYFAPQMFGGYYQPNDKKGDHPKWGTMQIDGVNVPTFLIHNPLLETLQIGATIRHVADSKLRKKDAEKQGIPNGVMAGVLGVVSEVPFVRQAEDIVKTLNPYERQKYFNQVARDLVVPLGVKWVAEHFDKDAKGNMIPRDPQTIWQSIESAVPGLRQKVPTAKKKP